MKPINALLGLRRADAKRSRLLAPYVLLTVLSTLFAFALEQGGWRWSRTLDNLAIDIGFRLRGETDARLIADLPQTKGFLIVELDHQLPRPLLAKLVDKLRFARVVALDLMIADRVGELSPQDRDSPVWQDEIRRWRGESAQLAASFKRANNVVIGVWPERARADRIAMTPSEQKKGFAASSSSQRVDWKRPPAMLWNAARWHAHLRVEPDAGDGLVRRVRLVEKTPFNALPLPSFGLAAARAGGMRSRGALWSASTVENEADGMLIDYLGGIRCFEDDQVRIVASRVLNDSEPEDFRDMIVFVGETNWASKDIFPTPYGDIPGVHIQAHAAATLLRPGGGLAAVAPVWTLLFTLCASLLVLVPLMRWPLWSSGVATVSMAVALVLAVAALAANASLVLPLSVPLIAIALTYNSVALLEMWRARATLGRFIGANMVAQALNPLEVLKLGGRIEYATAFFCDLRGYSRLSETLSPQRAAELLQAYTTTLTRIVEARGGRPIDYLGDGVFVLFEARHTRGEHAREAALAAVDAQKAFTALASQWKQYAWPDGAPMEAAIAIHSGEMLIGFVGDENHLKPGAVGDAVNVAAHAQGYSKQCGYSILVTRDAAESIGNGASAFDLKSCGFFTFKGRQSKVELLGLIASGNNPGHPSAGLEL